MNKISEWQVKGGTWSVVVRADPTRREIQVNTAGPVFFGVAEAHTLRDVLSEAIQELS